MKKRLFFLGDTHGNNHTIEQEIIRLDIRDANIFHVGDFCAGFTSLDNDDKIMKRLDDFLRKRNIIMRVVRGNHDNPAYFEGYNVMDNLILLKDYSVIDIEGKKVLCVGGAISIDRVRSIATNHNNIKYGSPNRIWWKDEIFVYNEDIIKEMRDIDIVVTHTSPSLVFPKDTGNWPTLVSFFFEDDELLEVMLIKERTDMTLMYESIKENNNITNWFYGHFHHSKETILENTKFRCLEICELFEVH